MLTDSPAGITVPRSLSLNSSSLPVTIGGKGTPLLWPMISRAEPFRKSKPTGIRSRTITPVASDDAVFSATTTLEWSERKKSDDEVLKDLKFDSTYKQTLSDKGHFTFAIAKKDTKYYVKASAAFVGSADDK